MNFLNKIFFVILFYCFFASNTILADDKNQQNVVVDDAIVVESDFDLEQTYGEKSDYSDIDPIEGFNREVWDFNLGLDKIIVRPVTRGYVDAIPDPFRRGLGNAINNFFKTPQYFINNLLQGKFVGAYDTFMRALIKTNV